MAKWLRMDGLRINIKKTEHMCVGTHDNIILDDEDIRTCNKYKYLGSIITKEGNCNNDINTRIAMGK